MPPRDCHLLHLDAVLLHSLIQFVAQVLSFIGCYLGGLAQVQPDRIQGWSYPVGRLFCVIKSSTRPSNCCRG